jgi:hypothetical protein
MQLKKDVVISIFVVVCMTCSFRVQAGANSKESATGRPEVVVVTVCEVVKNGAAFEGKYISVRGFVIGGVGHGIVVVNDDCSGGLSLDPPEAVREREDYLAFMRTVLKEGGGFTRDSKSRVVAKFDGLLEYHPKEHRKWVLRADRISEVEVKQNVNKAGGPL